MSETSAGRWQPDPYGRYAQRWHDGTNWTANVTDASGAQLTDPPGYTSAPPATTAAASTGAASPPVPGLVVAGIGALLLLLSLFVLNWFDFNSSVKDELNSNASDVEAVLGVKASDITDGIKMT